MTTEIIVEIQCPNCNNVLEGKIESHDNFPFVSYFGHCNRCDYDITESEWDEVWDEE